MEVEGGLDNGALVLALGLKGLKRLSRLSLERKRRPILSGLGFWLLFGVDRAIFLLFFSFLTHKFNHLLFGVLYYPAFLFPGLSAGGF